MDWTTNRKQAVLDAIGHPNMHLIREGGKVWVLMILPHPNGMVRRSVRIKSVADRTVGWWVERANELIAGDTSDVEALHYLA